MTNKERYRQAFGVLHSSREIKLETETENRSNNKYVRRAVLVCVCAVLVMGIGVTAYAAGGYKIISGWGGNAEIRQEFDENGEYSTYAYLYTENLKEPVEIEGGRIYFIVNGEHMDITKTLKNEAFTYEYTDDDGNIHHWIIGLNREEPESYGYGEYIQDADGNWLGGYSARANAEADGKGPEWLKIGKEKIGVPW